MEPYVSRTVEFILKACKGLCTSALEGIQSLQGCLHFGKIKIMKLLLEVALDRELLEFICLRFWKCSSSTGLSNYA